jgi:hypothetical protein
MMKKKIIVVILMILMYVILTSCNSCTSCTTGAAQSPGDTTLQYIDSPLINTSNDTLLNVYPDMLAENIQDTSKNIYIKKQVSKMQIDTSRDWKAKRDSMYQELEKTEKGLKVQQRTLDSMLVVKKK